MAFETSNASILYNSQLTTSNATLYTSSAGDGLKAVYALNTTGSAATVSVTVVRKGGTATDTEAVVLANALSVPANSATNLTAAIGLTSEYSELLLETGDYLYGEASAGTTITLLVIGS